MYGMIHRGIREMVLELKGAEAWSAIEQACGIGPVELISAVVYDDVTTFAIVGSAAEVLGMDVPTCLKHFGRYWIRFAERGSYGPLMDFTGQDLATFIANLDRMHASVTNAMPQAQTPSFSLSGPGNSEIRVRYWSSREGLEPFVIGLLEGLLDRFGESGTVTQCDSKTNGTDFVIRLAAA